MTFLRTTAFRLIALLLLGATLSACSEMQIEQIAYTEDGEPLPFASRETIAMYAEVQDGEFLVPAVPRQYLSEERKRQVVDYYAPHAPGTIVVDPYDRKMYHILGDNKAMRYTIGVGEGGYGLTGTAHVAFQRDWPYWTPTRNMLRREPEKYRPVASGLPGGLENPLGARALYLYRGGRDTLFRIHGTPYAHTVGEADSGGCIRMFQQDSIYLASQVPNGTKVVILTAGQQGQWTAQAASS